MLATLVVKEPFQRPGWVYEEKYDGYRILAYKEGAGCDAAFAQCEKRSHPEHFSAIARAVGELPAEAAAPGWRSGGVRSRVGACRASSCCKIWRRSYMAMPSSIACTLTAATFVSEHFSYRAETKLEKVLGKPVGKQPILFCSSRLSGGRWIKSLRHRETQRLRRRVLAKDEGSNLMFPAAPTSG